SSYCRSGLSCFLLIRFFFFYCLLDHRDLHSFPTRRSSDLDMFARLRHRAVIGGDYQNRSVHLRGAGDHVLNIVGMTRAVDMSIRSEEHTSELQSRENLVCRLLLEKKKKNRQTHDYKKYNQY